MCQARARLIHARQRSLDCELLYVKFTSTQRGFCLKKRQLTVHSWRRVLPFFNVKISAKHTACGRNFVSSLKFYFNFKIISDITTVSLLRKYCNNKNIQLHYIIMKINTILCSSLFGGHFPSHFFFFNLVAIFLNLRNPIVFIKLYKLTMAFKKLLS